MLARLLAVLRMALTPLIIVQSMLASIDANDQGLDDKAAEGLGKVRQGIGLLLDGVGQLDLGGTPGQAKGLVAIVQFCNGVTARLEAILAAPTMTDELKAEAKGLYDSLSDNSKVYQAKRGDDADALNSAKAKASSLLSQIQSR